VKEFETRRRRSRRDSGADATKVRPAVVLSTELYHRYRPDVIVGLMTTQPPGELAPTDCELRDWRHAGLHQPSFFRLFTVTLLQRDVRLIGRLSDLTFALVRPCFNSKLDLVEEATGDSLPHTTWTYRRLILRSADGPERGLFCDEAPSVPREKSCAV
jgi:mRNA interferase MazF